jgi:glycosyltransferase involved in cell wall biosynthesis
MPSSLCLFLGGADSFNVGQTTQNIARMLSHHFDIHLVTTEPDMLDDNVLAETEIFGEDSPSTRFGEVSALSGYFRENDPAVATHISEPPIHGTILTVLASRHDVPAVYRYSGDRFYEYRVGRGRKRLLWFGLNNVLGRVPLLLADAHITLGPTGKSRLTERGVDAERVSVLPPPIDQSRFDGANELPSPLSAVPDERSVALFVGRRSYLKGFDTFDATIPKILERRNDLQFVFVGDGERIPQVLDQYADHVTIVGRVPPESIPTYFHHADLLLHPSLTEGLSRAVLEAVMCDTPVIVRDVGDMASVTTNTFTTDAEFVELVCGFESLPLDDPEPFSMAKLQEQYKSFFAQFVR